MHKLFEPTTIGSIDVKNRVFMAPLTRNRAHNDTDIPHDLAIEYYRQRATAGLILTEATQVSAMGKGYLSTPGIYTDEQTSKWKEIVNAVHNEGGKILLQLWHVGRISHSSLLPDNAQPHAPSAIAADGQTFTADGFQDCSKPKEMTIEEIEQTVADFKLAAENCKKAGFDGVEIHGANGYLINQFLSDHSNKRDDDYGGSIENRSRFLFEIVDAVTQVYDASKAGIRLSPTGKFNDMDDSDPYNNYSYIIDRLNKYGLAYLHMVEKFPGVDVGNQDFNTVMKLAEQWNGAYIANGNYNVLDANTAVESGYADAITFGRPFISNPDLPKRLEIGAELNEGDNDTYYGGGAEGYTDYPFLDESRLKSA